jgi:hypothetical protein
MQEMSTEALFLIAKVWEDSLSPAMKTDTLGCNRQGQKYEASMGQCVHKAYPQQQK